MMDREGSPKIGQPNGPVVIKSLNVDEYGFCIGTQEAYFKTPDGLVNVRYKEDEIINLSFVISAEEHLLTLYLNGILSGILTLTQLDSSKFNLSNLITINSEYCDIDLYNIRLYKSGLNMPKIIHNYIADTKNIELYDENNLTNDTDGTLLSYNKLVEYNKTHPDNPTMPYMVIEITDNDNNTQDPVGGTHSE